MLHLNQIQSLIHKVLCKQPCPAQGNTRNSAVHIQASMSAVSTTHLCPLLFLGASHHGLLGLKEKTFCFSNLFPILDMA